MPGGYRRYADRGISAVGTRPFDTDHGEGPNA
jgi:hypothetical protein